MLNDEVKMRVSCRPPLVSLQGKDVRARVAKALAALQEALGDDA